MIRRQCHKAINGPITRIMSAACIILAILVVANIGLLLGCNKKGITSKPGKAALADSGILVFDLDGDGPEFTRLRTSTVFFDLDGDNFATKTAWVRPDDGLLVLDRNGDGVINNTTELFGNQHVPGFQILAQLDSNGDGKISAADARFSELRIWRDLNGDAVSQAEELTSLEQSGIAAINLSNTMVTTQTILNIKMCGTGIYTRPDGATRQVVAVLFGTESEDTKYVGPVTIDPDVYHVADIKGYGRMADLYIAMSLNKELKQKVLDTVMTRNPNRATLPDDFEQILYKWAGVENITINQIDPTAKLALDPKTGKVWFPNAARDSRFSHVPIGLSLQQLGVVKAYSGLDVLNLKDRVWVENGKQVTTGGYYQQAWDQAYRNLLAKFAVGNAYVVGYLNTAHYEMETDHLVVEFNIRDNADRVFGEIVDRLIRDASKDATRHGLLLTALVLTEIDPTVRQVFADKLKARLAAGEKAQLALVLQDRVFRAMEMDLLIGGSE